LLLRATATTFRAPFAVSAAAGPVPSNDVTQCHQRRRGGYDDACYPLTAEFAGVEVTVLKGVVNLSQFDVALLVNETSITAYLFRAIQRVIKIVG
jgi:hypothetical protein